MVILVARVLKDAEEDEARRDRGVEDAQEDEGWDHEGERDLLVQRLEGAESWGGHVLVASVSIHDGAHKAEDDDLGNSAGPQGLGEVPDDLVNREALNREYYHTLHT